MMDDFPPKAAIKKPGSRKKAPLPDSGTGSTRSSIPRPKSSGDDDAKTKKSSRKKNSLPDDLLGSDFGGDKQDRKSQDGKPDIGTRDSLLMKAPSAKEEVFEWINKARMMPPLFAKFVEHEMRFFTGSSLEKKKPGRKTVKTKEGSAALRELIQFLETATPSKNLERNTGLEYVAQEYAMKICTEKKVPSKALQQKCLDKFGKSTGVVKCVVLDTSEPSGLEVILSFLVDDGVKERPHRQILLDEKMKVLGIGIDGDPHDTRKDKCVLFLAEAFEYNGQEGVKLDSEDDLLARLATIGVK